MASSSDAENRLDPNAQQFRPPGQPPPSQSVPSQQQQQQQGRGEDHGNTAAAVRSGTKSPHLQSRLAGYQHHHQRNTTLPQSYPPPFQRQQHLSFQYSPQFQPIPSFVQHVDEQTHVSWGSQWSASVSQNVSVSSQRSSPQQESLPQTHLQRWSSLSPPPIAMFNVSSSQQQVFRPDVSAAPRPSQQQPEPQAFLPTSITSLSLEPGASSRGRGFLPFNPYHHPGHSAFTYSGLMSGGSGQERSPTTVRCDFFVFDVVLPLLLSSLTSSSLPHFFSTLYHCNNHATPPKPPPPSNHPPSPNNPPLTPPPHATTNSNHPCLKTSEGILSDLPRSRRSCVGTLTVRRAVSLVTSVIMLMGSRS